MALGLPLAILAIIILAVLALFVIGMFIVGIVIFIIGIVKNKSNKKKGKPTKLWKIFIIIGILLIAISLYFIIPAIDAFWVTEKEEAELNEMKYRSSNTIVEAMKTEDVEFLKNAFTNIERQNATLDYQILQMYDFIDGNIVDYTIEEPDSSIEDSGQHIKKYQFVEIRDIKTDTGNVYRLLFRECRMNAEDKRQEGIIGIKVIAKDNTFILVGDY